MDWTQLDRWHGKTRHALVRQLADMRRTHSVFTDVNGSEGLTWLDTTASESVTAFVRRNGRDTVLVVQNWTDRPVECEVAFTVQKTRTATYLAPDDTDLNVHGSVSATPILSRSAEHAAGNGFALGPWGWWISEVVA